MNTLSLTKSLSQSEYNKSSHFYDEVMNSFKMDFSLYEDLAEVLRPSSVLEMGCGMGRLFPIFSREVKEIVGVDMSDELLSKGRQYYEAHGNMDTTVEFINSDMCLFEDDRKFDLVIFALSVLKHLSNDSERFRALENAKKHLSQDGFIVIDHTPLLYASKPVDWVDAKHSVVASWLQDPNILDGYQWKKSIEGERDILEWRHRNSGQVDFEVKFTTYRYDIGYSSG